VVEAERVRDLVHGHRAQVLRVAFAADLREDVNDRVALHATRDVRTDTVRAAIVEIQL
jgi:hypothetical protein